MLWSGVVGAQLGALARSGSLAGVAGSSWEAARTPSGACSFTGVLDPASLITRSASADGTLSGDADAVTWRAGGGVEGDASAALCEAAVLGVAGVVMP